MSTDFPVLVFVLLEIIKKQLNNFKNIDFVQIDSMM